jgi:hypothetical protein
MKRSAMALLKQLYHGSDGLSKTANRHLPAQRKLLGQIDFGHRPPAKPAQDVKVFQLFTHQIGHTNAPGQ